MKDKSDLVEGWLLKARSDMNALRASLDAGVFDAVNVRR